MRNTNNKPSVPRSDQTLNQKANLILFNINEVVFHDDDASIIDGHILIMTPVISTENEVYRCDEPALSQYELSTISMSLMVNRLSLRRSPFRTTHL